MSSHKNVWVWRDRLATTCSMIDQFPTLKWHLKKKKKIKNEKQVYGVPRLVSLVSADLFCSIIMMNHTYSMRLRFLHWTHLTMIACMSVFDLKDPCLLFYKYNKQISESGQHKVRFRLQVCKDPVSVHG